MLESYSDFKQEDSYKRLHGRELDLCFDCAPNSFDCEGHTLLNAHVPTSESNLRLKIWPVDMEAFNKQNMFMAFKFDTTTGNPVLLGEIFWIRVVLLVTSLLLLFLHVRVRKLPFSDFVQRNELLRLIGRQLFLQVFMNDPLWILVFTYPGLLR